MTEKYQPIPHRLKNMAVGGHVAGAEDIDAGDGKTQQDINADTYRKNDTYSKEQLNNMITTPEQEYVNLVAESGDTLSDIFDGITGSADTTYRVGCWDGEEYNTAKFAEYSWDGTDFILLNVQTPGIDENPTAGSGKLVESGGTYNNIASSTGNGNVAYSAMANEYVTVGATWEPKVLKTSTLSVGDTITDESYEANGSGVHLILDVSKYNTSKMTLKSFRYKSAGSSSYHSFIYLDDQYKVVYISNDTTTQGSYEVINYPSTNYDYKYVVFNNFLTYQSNPNIQVLVSDKTGKLITQKTENGDIAYSAECGEYVSVDNWELKVLNTSNLSEGDTVSDSNYDKTDSGVHLVIDAEKYNNANTILGAIKYKIAGSVSYHLFVLLDEDSKVVYISNSISTYGDYTVNSTAFSSYTYRYIVFNNFNATQENPDVQVLVKDKVNVRCVPQDFTEAEQRQISNNIGLISKDAVTVKDSYSKVTIDVETGELVDSTAGGTLVKEYALESGRDYLASGRTTNTDEKCSIAYYDSQMEYIGHDKEGSSHATNFIDYPLVVPDGAAYVRVYGRRGGTHVPPALREIMYFKDIDFESIGEEGANKLKGKTVAIIGASMDTHGNTGSDRNAVEITIEEEDVGVELSAYVTYYDVQSGLSLGGTTFTTADIGTEVTFTPTLEDVGKVIGKPNDFNGSSIKVWWQYIKDYFDCDVIPVCWSGSGYTRNRQGGSDGNKYYTSHAWHDAQIRKCGIRTPGTMERTAPDVIILSRVGNDFSHSPYGRITEGYFDTVDWQYPDSDIREDGKYGILEAVSLTIKKLRETYPFTPIVMCDNIPMKRVNHDHFPMNNGYNNQPQLNKAMKEAADFFGCQFIPRSKCAITWENMYPAYVHDDNVHPIEAGHRVIGKFVVDYMKQMNFTV